MEIAAVACLACFGMGAFGIGFSARELKRAHKKAIWTDSREVAPLECQTRKYIFVNESRGLSSPVIRINDTDGNVMFVIEHASFYSSVWVFRDVCGEKLATIHASALGTYYMLKDEPDIKHYCVSREAGRFREFVKEKDGIVSTYRWYSKAYHLERVVVEPRAPNAPQDEVTILHEVVGNCKRLRAKPLSFEFNIDTTRVDVVSALASGFISMMSEWRKKKPEKSQATIDLERDEALSRLKRFVNRRSRYNQNGSEQQTYQARPQATRIPPQPPVPVTQPAPAPLPTVTVNINTDTTTAAAAASIPTLQPQVNQPVLAQPTSMQSDCIPEPYGDQQDLGQDFADFFSEADELEEIEEQEEALYRRRHTYDDNFYADSRMESKPYNAMRTASCSNPTIKTLHNANTPVVRTPSKPRQEGEAAVFFPKKIVRKAVQPVKMAVNTVSNC